ncbi:MAG: succinate dehydrogenase iron-sulfur subunit [Candidatus Korarchaeota archaeon]|nr:succinate dehydrogenase iron-sulfur subunit [Candidatus Korarchaeota archaeon]MDK2383716.1 succinate dehydrogenase iron-sulfur subunit [Candidatus Korarchaeota archaeon]
MASEEAKEYVLPPEVLEETMKASEELWKPVRKIKFRIYKYNPRKDYAPYWEEHELEVSRGMTVLDALLIIKGEADHSLGLRYSCRMGLCGSCAMMINGKQMLACQTRVLEAAGSGDVVELRPLDNFPVERDLAADFTSFFEKHRAVKPWIIRNDDVELNNPTGPYKQTVDEYARYYQFTDCIKCGACLSACPTAATDYEYLGPQALAQAYRYIVDTRDDGLDVRIPVVDTEHGCWRCHFAASCSDVCPRGVDPAQGIQLLKKLLIKRKFGFKPHKPAEALPAKVKAEKKE